MLEAKEKSSQGAKEEEITVKEVLDLANSITLDHYSHVYIEQFEQIQACFTIVLDDIKE